jgi:hypothetical protein
VSGASRLIRGNELLAYQDWRSIPKRLKAEATRWVYIGPNGSWWDLEGRDAGKQGVRLAKELQGAYHLPFEHLLTEAAYQVGATYERSNIQKRLINLGVVAGARGSHNTRLTSDAYRHIEANWWNAWPHDTPGWLGCHTRFGGWRWAQVQLAKAVDTSVSIDPAAMNNNVQKWDMQIMGVNPWYAKRTLVEKWTAHAETVTANGFDEETITICNRGHLPVWPLFIYTGPGRAWVQDGMTTKMIPLPTLSVDDKYGLVDTDPSHRTLTGATDPVDNIFYQIIRQSKILDFFLHDVEALGLPLWRRANGIRFTSQIPPKTVANIKVRHDTAGGTVTLMLPQRFIRPS